MASKNNNQPQTIAKKDFSKIICLQEIYLPKLINQMLLLDLASPLIIIGRENGFNDIIHLQDI